MRRTFLLCLAILGTTTSAASAATLYTNTAHTTPVASGTTATLTTRSPFVLTSGTLVYDTCHSTLTASLVPGGGTVTAAGFSNCHPLTPFATHATTWTLGFGVGAGTTTGDVTRWPASLHMGFTFGAGSSTNYNGTLTGVATQTGANGHVCLQFDHAGPLDGTLFGPLLVDATYCFVGAASTYSLG
jgi:hypothetical protein